MKVLKFSTPTCGQCKVVEQLLKKKGIEFTEIDCTKDESQEMVGAYHITHVPVVLVIDEKGYLKRLNNIAEVKEWLAHIN